MASWSDGRTNPTELVAYHRNWEIDIKCDECETISRTRSLGICLPKRCVVEGCEPLGDGDYGDSTNRSYCVKKLSEMPSIRSEILMFGFM